jgi:hypothetical protein
LAGIFMNGQMMIFDFKGAKNERSKRKNTGGL